MDSGDKVSEYEYNSINVTTQMCGCLLPGSIPVAVGIPLLSNANYITRSPFTIAPSFLPYALLQAAQTVNFEPHLVQPTVTLLLSVVLGCPYGVAIVELRMRRIARVRV
jgi:hypothetical protein